MKPDTSAFEIKYWQEKTEAEMELYRLQIEIYAAKIEMHKRIMEEEIKKWTNKKAP